MHSFERLIRFLSSDGDTYFAELKDVTSILPKGDTLCAFRTFDELVNRTGTVEVVVEKILPPIPRTDQPIYCVGLNYRSHAKEAGLNIPRNPPLWTKPSAALAEPGEEILLSHYCASSFPDWEGELVFITSAECRDVSPEEAGSYILGYTIGNDLSCRLFQTPEQNGGQFFYAKAFDKFAPIGPVLVAPTIFRKAQNPKLTTRVNGEVMQEADLNRDMIFSPEQVLSFMSQSTSVLTFLNPSVKGVLTKLVNTVTRYHNPSIYRCHDWYTGWSGSFQNAETVS